METDLLVHFAEIVAVFLGFGTLISLRSARPTEAHDVYLQVGLGAGVWVSTSLALVGGPLECSPPNTGPIQAGSLDESPSYTTDRDLAPRLASSAVVDPYGRFQDQGL